jgi:TrmH family RNA methyltransferase
MDVMSMPLSERLRRVSSPQNTLVKELRRALSRAEMTPDGYMAIEGLRIIDEAIRSGLRFKAVFFSASAESRAERVLPQIGAHVETLLLPDNVFDGAVATETPQGVAALVKGRSGDLEAALQSKNPLIVALAGLQDPGNVGTIIRSAEAFGANAVLLGKGSVSALNPKVARAAAGSLFRMNLVPVELESTIAELRSHGIRLVGTSSHKGRPASEVDLTGSVALFLGNEGTGLSREIAANLDEHVLIPHSPRVESLNAGVAASILLYEAARQRGTFSETQKGK